MVPKSERGEAVGRVGNFWGRIHFPFHTLLRTFNTGNDLLTRAKAKGAAESMCRYRNIIMGERMMFEVFIFFYSM